MPGDATVAHALSRSIRVLSVYRAYLDSPQGQNAGRYSSEADVLGRLATWQVDVARRSLEAVDRSARPASDLGDSAAIARAASHLRELVIAMEFSVVVLNGSVARILGLPLCPPVQASAPTMCAFCMKVVSAYVGGSSGICRACVAEADRELRERSVRTTAGRKVVESTDE